mgnify:CR=1 FL=1
MAAVGESGPSSGSEDPYARLGLAPGASFDEVQAARSRCLAQTDDDPQAKARVEAAYDAVLMARLRDRQQGQVSAAAATALDGSGSSVDTSVVLRRHAPALAHALHGVHLVDGRQALLRPRPGHAGTPQRGAQHGVHVGPHGPHSRTTSAL